MDLLRPIRDFSLLQKLISKFSAGVVERGLHATQRAEKLQNFHRAFRFLECNGIQGDILQFGVAEGFGLALIEQCAREEMTGKNANYRIFAFDSFEGLPDPEGRDMNVHTTSDSAVRFDRGTYAAGKDVVVARLKKRRADMERIHLTEGWFDEKLTPELRDSLGIERAVLIDVDCDFYDSTRVMLNWCEPLIQQGTIINFDDWFCYQARQDHGERAAFREFLDEHPDIEAEPYFTYAWSSKSFLIHRS